MIRIIVTCILLGLLVYLGIGMFFVLPQNDNLAYQSEISFCKQNGFDNITSEFSKIYCIRKINNYIEQQEIYCNITYTKAIEFPMRYKKVDCFLVKNS